MESGKSTLLKLISYYGLCTNSLYSKVGNTLNLMDYLILRVIFYMMELILGLII